ncbi:hypothetical protein ACFYY3_22535 [Streptomyces sp. NPDC001812]|uniref:Uncharacterized protein n=1 Tax=Streptomyces cathayae TaxID=3031124 RepID=A0ABY8JXT1_9ACTN|nr:hypothetical protein [Streptomyces sp. HUAS 5]WGD40606.1 hypothetical protein PYS65_10875 [Streptomyces sp. HUAS 5]
MYEYEIHTYRSAELIREAEQEHQAREAVRLERAARRKAAARGAEPGSHSRGPRRHRFTRAV